MGGGVVVHLQLTFGCADLLLLSALVVFPVTAGVLVADSLVIRKLGFHWLDLQAA